MKPTPKWQRKLTAKQRRHIKEWCRGTMRGVKEAIAHQARQNADLKQRRPDLNPTPCWDCQSIARTLGWEE